jgi:hypothetical protein
VNNELLEYCQLDVEWSQRVFRRERGRWHFARKTNRAERNFVEDGILPVALHDDSRIGVLT